jgi:hypothetical protein
MTRVFLEVFHRQLGHGLGFYPGFFMPDREGVIKFCRGVFVGWYLRTRGARHAGEIANLSTGWGQIRAF